MTRPWHQTHPRKFWSTEDWAEARRLGVVPPELDLNPTERILAQQAQAGPKLAWGPPADPADARRREAKRRLEEKGLRPRRW